jgi:hypothetical protein
VKPVKTKVFLHVNLVTVHYNIEICYIRHVIANKIILMFIIVQIILYVNLVTIPALIAQIVVFLLVLLAINLYLIIEFNFNH